IILHLDEDVVTVALSCQVAFAEPDAGNDHLDLIRFGVRSRGEECGGGQKGECGERKSAYLHVPPQESRRKYTPVYGADDRFCCPPIPRQAGRVSKAISASTRSASAAGSAARVI